MVYVGSKARLAKHIVPLLQEIIDRENIKTYVEPFVGGANVIDKIRCDRRIGVDIHEGLIDLYNAVQTGWRPPEHITEEEYKLAKDGTIGEPLKSYIGFNGSFASKYFGGFARGFKADKITPRDIYNERTRNFTKQIPLLVDIEFYSTEYDALTGEGGLIYCDPPYRGTTKYAVKDFDHRVFWEWVRSMSKKNIVLVSEFNAPEDFEVLWEKERTSSLDKNTGSKRNVEKLFKHGRTM